MVVQFLRFKYVISSESKKLISARDALSKDIHRIKMDAQTHGHEKLAEIERLAEKTTKKMVCEARLMLDMSSFKPALDIKEDFGYITTGSEKLNDILGGGITTGRLTEVAGAFKSGKTCLSSTIV